MAESISERLKAVADRLEQAADVFNTTSLDADIAELRKLTVEVVVRETLDRAIPGHYDLDDYTPDDLYWEVMRPVAEQFLPGRTEKEVRAAVKRWYEEEIA